MPEDDRQWVIDAMKRVPWALSAYHLVDPSTANGCRSPYSRTTLTGHRSRLRSRTKVSEHVRVHARQADAHLFGEAPRPPMAQCGSRPASTGGQRGRSSGPFVGGLFDRAAHRRGSGTWMTLSPLPRTRSARWPSPLGGSRCCCRCPGRSAGRGVPASSRVQRSRRLADCLAAASSASKLQMGQPQGGRLGRHVWSTISRAGPPRLSTAASHMGRHRTHGGVRRWRQTPCYPETRSPHVRCARAGPESSEGSVFEVEGGTIRAPRGRAAVEKPCLLTEARRRPFRR